MPQELQVHKYDVLIIGAGAAGLRVALEVAKIATVALVSKVHPVRSQSVMATDGIAAALGGKTKDTWADHVKDTIEASHFLADQDAVEFMCRQAPDIIRELDEEYGAIFTRTTETTLAQRQLAGHSKGRAVFGGERTGQTIVHTLYEQLTKYPVKLFNEHQAVQLVIEENSIKGVIAFDIATGELVAIAAKVVVIATGGAGQIYKATTNATAATGDGIALAFHAGALLKDMEFVQFHPTTLPNSHRIIPECVRSYGAILLNPRSQAFLKRCDAREELAPQDVIAQAVMHEMHLTRRDGCIYVDMRHVEKAVFDKRLKNLQEFIKLQTGLDMTKDPIPAVPAQHALLGGIATTIEGATDIEGLFAVGECACISVHGAARLEGNGLLEALVFGKQVGQAVKDLLKKKKPLTNAEYIALRIGLRDAQEILEKYRQAKTGTGVQEIQTKMQLVMDEHAGIIRIKKGLEEAQEKIQQLKEELQGVALNDKSLIYNTELVQIYETAGMLDLAQAIICAALAREESRGTHYRQDCKEQDNKNWLKHSIIRYHQDGPELLSENVKLTRLKPA